MTTGGSPPTFIPQTCPDGTYAVDMDDEGMLVCTAFDGDVRTAVEDGCDLYFGWRDSCNGCGSGPAKSGRVSRNSCENFAGADNTCTTATLGAESLALYGLNTDGDVNGDDVFYAGVHCPRIGETGLAGPCEAGEHAVSVTVDGHVSCMPTDLLATEFVRDHCTLYWGWRDNCSGCTEPPSKWGSQRDAECAIGAGNDNYCGVPFVNDQWIAHVGINTDGDVDDNDTFFMGFHCEAPATDVTDAAGRCPFGTLLTGLNEDGTLQCTAPTPDIAPAVRDQCGPYLGYRDSCGGCASDPVKWGSTTTTSCDAGLNSTCNTHDLGGTMVSLVGVRGDGDVDGNDKFYVGFSCGD